MINLFVCFARSLCQLQDVPYKPSNRLCFVFAPRVGSPALEGFEPVMALVMALAVSRFVGLVTSKSRCPDCHFWTKSRC